MIVGRDAERRLIERLVAGARVGESGLLVVTGEAGIGKTALLAASLPLTTGMEVLRATGRAEEQGLAFAGLLQVLRPALGLLDDLPEPQAEALGVALALRRRDRQETWGADRFAVGAATLTLLCRFAEQRPVAVLVDDANLLDRPSAEALAFAARRLLADPVVLLVAARSDTTGPLTEAGLPVLILTGLDVADSGALLTRSAPHPVVAGLARRAHQATGGNPLALLELAGGLDALAGTPPGLPATVPLRVAGAFLRRVQQLPAPARTALLVSVIAAGDLTAAGPACRAMGVGLRELEPAERAGLLHVAGDRAEPTHPLVASAVYGDAPADQRRAVHAALAVAVDDPDRTAWHRSEAALGPDEAVALALEAAAQRADGRGAPSVASAAFERAARLSGPHGPRAERLTRAGDTAWRAGQADRAAALLEEALDADPPATLLARVHELRGVLAAAHGDPGRALEILTGAAEQTTHPDAAVGLLCEAALACFLLGDAGSALVVATQLEDLLAGALEDRSRTLALLAAGLARVLGGHGGADSIRAAVHRLPDVDDLQDEPRRSAWLLLGPLWLREQGAGRELAARALEEVRERAAVGALPFLLFLAARDAATTDRWSVAEAWYEEAVGLAAETGGVTDSAAAGAGLAWLYARQGRAAECRSRALATAALCETHALPVFRAWVLFALGELELSTGEPSVALTHFESLHDALRETGLVDVDLIPGPEHVEVLLRLGRVEQAQQVADRYADAARRKGQPWALARAERAAGLVCTPDRLAEHFTAALALHDRTSDVFETARTQLAYGARLRRARRRREARPQLVTSLESFERLGARAWADRAAVELKATGITAHRRESGTIDQLTAQELQVALMLAEGRTTRQAAAALFLSPKTVEHHLRHVYPKLGVTSREELTAAMRRDRPAPG